MKTIVWISLMMISMLSGNAKAQSEINTVSINPQDCRQTIAGWGVSLCWWANMCGRWSESRINEIVDLLVSPEGLNYNVFRYNIGGGDDPENRNCTPHHMGASGGKGLRAEMEGFKVYESSDYDWTRDEAQRRIMLKIKERRPDVVFEAFSNSAPWWMTYSGCCAGNVDGGKDNLKPEYYEAFAHYLVDVCKHYKEVYGIEFRTLEPFNEPLTSYWYANGSQEGCHFDRESQVAFLKILAPILKESGLSTRIAASDETAVNQSINAFEEYAADVEALSLIGQWNVHTYSASNADRTRLRSLVSDRSLPLWMSESGSGGDGIAGNLSMAQRLMDDMRYLMPDAWLDWQYVEEYGDQWNLVRANFSEQTYEVVKNYFVRQQITRFVKPGYTVLNVMDDQTLAALNPSQDSLVLVLLNNTDTPRNYCYDLSSFKQVQVSVTGYATSENQSLSRLMGIRVKNNKLEGMIPARSIRTYIVKVEVREGAVDHPSEDFNYMIVPRNGAYAITATGEGLSLTDCNIEDANQVWHIMASTDGYTITNENELSITNTGDYLLSAQPEYVGNQLFVFHKVNDGFFYIREADGARVFDLQGAVCNKGTHIGLYALGDAVTATTRQWALVPFFNYSLANSLDLNVVEKNVVICAFPGLLRVSNPLPKVPTVISVIASDGKTVCKQKCEGLLTDLSLQRGLYIVNISNSSFSVSRTVLVP
ncbi:MAG: hypothetical protein NC388_08845 [Clostridium sp.]|nr:hypothetical protein [Clostridium sp.]